MRKVACVALMALAACLAVAPQPVAANTRGCVTLYDYLLGNPKKYSIFSSAIETLPNLKPYSRCCDNAAPQQPALVLLPENSVIRNFLPVLNLNETDLLDDSELLEAVIRTHIVQSDKWEFKDGQTVKTANAFQTLEVTTSDDATCFAAWSFACAGSSAAPVPICQGYVVPINSVIVPNTGAYTFAG